jgi:arylsulfatase A-like enzyme
MRSVQIGRMMWKLSPGRPGAVRALLVGIATAATLFGANAQPTNAAGPAARKPSIIFILADDLGYGDLGCYGQTKIKTPNLDRLAAEGMRFTSFYAGSTVCAPSRCALMTGLDTGHAYIRGNGAVPLRPQDVTVAEVLKRAGYHTGLIGKWGLGDQNTSGVPQKQGFDEFLGYLSQAHAHDYYTDHLWRYDPPGEVKPGFDGRMPIPQNQDGQKGVYTDDLFTTAALNFLRINQPDQFNHYRPFFLYLAYTLPHANNEEGKRSGNGMEVPSDAPYSDQSAGPLRGLKRDLYEGGIRVPMIVRWPGKVPAGTTNAEPWAFWDFLPTAANLAGGKVPERIDGISLLPTLLGQAQTNHHEFLYWEFHERGFQQAVRMGDWKAVRPPAGAPLELYNLGTDPGEQHDVAARNPEIVARIEAYLKTARTESEHWPIKAAQPEPARKQAQK